VSDWFSGTDVGLKRSNNEDRVHVDSERGFVILADGMGGTQAGEVASGLAVESIARHLEQNAGFWILAKRQRERATLIDAVRKANRRVFSAAGDRDEQHGMGTTVVVLWIRSGAAHVAHVGDSRLYRLRAARLEAITRDHSTRSPGDPSRFLLTRAVGTESDIEVDHQMIEIARGDVFLLCSDGLSSVVAEEEIRRALVESARGEATVKRLIALAHEGGAPDNVSVALVYC